MVDKDRIEGKAKQAGGAIKEAAGKAFGDKKTEAEGAAKQAEGKAEDTAGSIKDKAREVAGEK